MRTRSFDKATDRLLRWSEREEWAQRHLELRALHFACLGEMLAELGLPEDALDALPGEATDMLDVFIVEDFFTAWFGEREELNVVDDYLERRGWREQAPVTRAVAREVMLRTGPIAPIVGRFWLMDTVAQAHRPAPEVRNTDDEALLHCEVRFPLNGERARVAVALDGIEALENAEHRRAAQQGCRPYDTAWIWRELGIEPPR